MKRLLTPFNLSLLLLLILVFIFLPQGGQGGDMQYWLRWIGYIQQLGLDNLYFIQEVNYFPIYIYILTIFGAIFPDPVSLVAHIYYIKFAIILFDFAALFLVGQFLQSRKIAPYWSYLILFNPAFFYNSLLWGQIESLYIFFVVAAFFAAISKHKYLSVVAFIFAFYCKLQAIIFVPALILLLLPQYLKTKTSLLIGFVIAGITQILVIFPFWGQVGEMFTNVFNSVDLFPVLSANAFNFWVLILGGANSAAPDSTKFSFLSMKLWGLLIFCVVSAIFLGPVLVDILRKRFRIEWRNAVYTLMLSNALVSLAFFYFNTQMHERYLQPTIIFMGIALILRFSKRLLALYIVVSIAFVLQLEKVGRLLELGNYELIIFSSRLIALTFGVCLVWGAFELYKNRNINTDIQTLRLWLSNNLTHRTLK